MANLPIFAIGKYDSIQPAIDEGILSYPSYVFIDDPERSEYNNRFAFIDKELNIRLMEGSKEVLRVDELPAAEDGDKDVLYIYDNVIYVFDGEEFVPSSDSGADLSEIFSQIEALQSEVETQKDEIAELKEKVATLEEYVGVKFIELDSEDEDEDENKIEVSSLSELQSAMADDSITSIVLEGDIESDASKVVNLESGGEKKLDLNGHDISVDGEAEDTIYAIYVTNGSTLNLYDSEGSGKVDAGVSSDFNMGVSAFGGSTINIYGGNYVAGTELDEATGSSTIYAMDGTINIYDGYFENTAMGIHKDCDILNIRNNSGSHIYCYGGSYLGQNPADGDDKDTATGSTFLADGYTVVESDVDGQVLYTVEKE